MLLAHIEARPIDPETPAARLAEQLRQRMSLLDEALSGVKELFEKGAVPRPLRPVCAQIATLAVTTHPIARKLLLGAEDGADDEPFNATACCRMS